MEQASPELPSTSDGWKVLAASLRPQRRRLELATAVGVVMALAKVAVPALVQQAIDRGIEGTGALLVWSLLIIATGAVVGVMTSFRRYLAFREARWLETTLRDRIFAHLQRLHVGYHDQAQTGQLMSRASSDLQQIQGFVVMIPLTISNLVMAVGVLVVLLTRDPLLTLVALAPLPMLNVFARRFSHAVHPAVLRVQAEQAQLATVVEETVAGVRVVKGLGAERVQAAKLREEAEDIRGASLEAARVRARFLPALDLLPALGIVTVLGLGGTRVLDGQMTIGELVAFNSYVTMLIWPLRSVGMTLAFGQRAAAALVRIQDVLRVDPVIADPPHPVRLPAHVPSVTGAVRFRNVRFGYDPERPVLDGFDLDIGAGESVAVVGATGSGKSTVSRLLVRFYDVQEGAVELDGIDVRSLAVHDLRRAVSVVFEDTFLFHDTVTANIAFADADVSPERVVAAARLAGADDFIRDLPDGYDTLLGERGFSLSGGQRQRIAIARAILADPRVLVLDDATSAVDPAKEHEIRDALRTVMSDRTTIVIAHRPATIALADRAVLVDEGRVVTVGTHAELLASSRRYQEVLAAMSHRDESLRDGELEAGSLDAGDLDAGDLGAGELGAGELGAGEPNTLSVSEVG